MNQAISSRIKILRDSLLYIWNSKKPKRTLILGAMLLYNLDLVIPYVFILGFLIRVFRHSSKGKDQPPLFENWWGLFSEGIQAYIIWHVYLILVVVNIYLVRTVYSGKSSTGILSIVISSLLGGGIISILIAITGQSINENVTSGLPTYVQPAINNSPSLETLILIFVAFYIAPAAIANFASEENFRAGFDLKQIKKIITNLNYFLWWIIFIFIWFCAYSLVLLPFLPKFYNRTDQVLTTAGNLTGSYGLLNDLYTIVLFLIAMSGFYLFIMSFYVLGHVWQIIDTPVRDYFPWLQDQGYYQRANSMLNKSGVSLSTVLIGSLTMSLNNIFLTIPIIGYLLTCSKYSGKTDDPKPSFENWIHLLRNGLYGMIIWAVYLAIPIILAWLWYENMIVISWLLVDANYNIYNNSNNFISSYSVKFNYWTIFLSSILNIEFTGYYSSLFSTYLQDFSNILYAHGLDVASVFYNAYPPSISDSMTYAAGIQLLLLFSLIFLLPSMVYIGLIAVISMAINGSFAAGFDIHTVKKVSDEYVFASAWRRIVLVWIFLWIPNIVWDLVYFNDKHVSEGSSLSYHGFPILGVASLEQLMYDGSAVLYGVVIFIALVLTYSKAGSAWKKCSLDEPNDQPSSYKNVLSFMIPRTTYLSPFIIFSTSGLGFLFLSMGIGILTFQSQ